VASVTEMSSSVHLNPRHPPFPEFSNSVIDRRREYGRSPLVAPRRLPFANNNRRLDIKSSTGGTSDKKSRKYLNLFFPETDLRFDKVSERGTGFLEVWW
jgi:hypothetical protein